MRKYFPIHPLLFSLFPVLFLFSKNTGEVQTYEIIFPAISIFLVTLILCFIFQLFLKNLFKTTVFSSLSIILFFSYGFIISQFSFTLFGHQITIHRIYFTILYLGIIPFLFFKIRKAGETAIKNISKILNLISIVLVTYSSAEASLKKYNLDPYKIDSPEYETKISDLGYLPDIYYFILDEYARQDILKNIHGLDNSPFVNALRERKFYVADSSHSNYSHTRQSLASLLNFEYLKGGIRLKDVNRHREMIQHNKAFATLKKSGYKIFAFPSGIEFSEFKNADKYFSFPHFTDFDLYLLHLTPLDLVLQRWVTIPIARECIRFPFETIQKMKMQDSPKLVFTHVLCPHPPFVFDSTGNAVDPKHTWSVGFDANFISEMGGTFQDFSNGYNNQLLYLNKLILPTIDSILAHSTHPPIIVLQGDHGSRTGMDYNKFEENEFTEQFSNFCALYLPGEGSKMLYPAITPVNIFRIIFNQYSGIDIPLLADHCYFYTYEANKKFVKVDNMISNTLK